MSAAADIAGTAKTVLQTALRLLERNQKVLYVELMLCCQRCPDKFMKEQLCAFSVGTVTVRQNARSVSANAVVAKLA